MVWKIIARNWDGKNAFHLQTDNLENVVAATKAMPNFQSYEIWCDENAKMSDDQFDWEITYRVDSINGCKDYLIWAVEKILTNL